MDLGVKALLSNGYWRVRATKTPIRVHWTTPLGLFLMSGFSFNPLVWAAILAVIFVHESGHAFLARHYHLRVESIDITGFGGVCRLRGDPTSKEASVVAWGGVIAQALLLIVAVLVRGFIHVITFGLLDGVWDALITTNLVVIGINLLPIAPLDGAMAWRLFRR